MTPAQLMKTEDYFYCEPLRATMQKKLCVEYQALANQAYKFTRDNVNALMWDRRLSCGDCPQGKEIARDYTPPKPGRRKKAIPNCCKVCHKCGRVRHKRSFYKNRTNPDGLQRTCKFCMKEYRNKRKEKADGTTYQVYA